jgi:hypothetical protein
LLNDFPKEKFSENLCNSWQRILLWEKLYAERVAMAYGRRPPHPPNFGGRRGAVRIARFENCYGPEGTLR